MTAEQLRRIEQKLDDALLQTTKNTADIAWIKRIGSWVGGLMAASLSYLWRIKA